MGSADRPEHAAVLKRVRVLISGRVQGVFFRATAAREAGRLGLTGWIRNLPDGRVEGAFQGPESSIDKIVAWCASDRAPGRVAGVDVEPEDIDPREHDFRVRG
jgi:acylphosphatase